MDLGGAPDDYEVAGERVYRKGNRSRGVSLARAAERKFDGHELARSSSVASSMVTSSPMIYTR